MNLHQIIGELRAELAAVDEVVSVLSRLAHTQEKRRSRPRLLLLDDLPEDGADRASDNGSANGKEAPKRRPFSAETRKKMAAAQKKRWAAAKKSKP